MSPSHGWSESGSREPSQLVLQGVGQVDAGLERRLRVIGVVGHDDVSEDEPTAGPERTRHPSEEVGLLPRPQMVDSEGAYDEVEVTCWKAILQATDSHVGVGKASRRHADHFLTGVDPEESGAGVMSKHSNGRLARADAELEDGARVTA